MGLYFGNNRPSKIFAGINNVTKVFWGNVQVWASVLYSWLKYGCTFVWKKYNAILRNVYDYDVYDAYSTATTTSAYDTISHTGLGPNIYYSSSIVWEENGKPCINLMTHETESFYVGDSKSYNGLYVYFPTFVWETALEETIWYSPTLSVSGNTFPLVYTMTGTRINCQAVNVTVGEFRERLIGTMFDYGTNSFRAETSSYYVKTDSRQEYRCDYLNYIGEVTSTQRNAYPDNGTPDNTYWYLYSNYTRDENPIGIAQSRNPSAYPDDGLQGDFYYIKQV